MRKLAVDGSETPVVRDVALSLIGRLKQKDYAGEACCCLRFVRDRIRYVRDTASLEVLQPPQTTLPNSLAPNGLGAGDCDDKSILLASLLAAIGHRPRFIAVSFAPDSFSHVWVQDFIAGRWLDLEPTEPIACGARIPEAGALGYMTREL